MMFKRLSTLALTLAVASPLSTAKAVGTQSYNVCGGSYSGFAGFAFCASVQLAVTNVSAGVYRVAMTIANMSGTNGSFAGTIFQNVGIDNVLGNVVDPADVVVTQDGATVCSNATNDTSGSAGCWNVKAGQGTAGGLNIDFLQNTSQGNSLALIGACSGAGTLNTCLNLHPVTIAFNIDTDFNPATAGNLYIKGQGGPNNQSTECITGGTSELCTHVTTTPEPATLGLMSTGLFALVPVFRRRRKSDESIES